MEHNGPTWNPKETKSEPTASKWRPKSSNMKPKRGKCIKSSPEGDPQNKKIDVQKRSALGRQPEFGGVGLERLSDESIRTMKKNGVETEVKTHPTSMQNQVPKNNMKHIKHLDLCQCFLMWKNIELGACERKRYQQIVKNNSQTDQTVHQKTMKTHSNFLSTNKLN